MAVIMPVRKLVAEIPIIETVGVPEFFISGTITIQEPDVVHILCYVNRHFGERIERHEVLRCHMGRNDYADNLAAAVARMNGGKH